MTQRDDMSETILTFTSVFTFVLLVVCPGGFLWFFLPYPIGIIAALACGCCGPWLMFKVDKAVYGPRP